MLSSNSKLRSVIIKLIVPHDYSLFLKISQQAASLSFFLLLFFFFFFFLFIIIRVRYVLSNKSAGLKCEN